MSEYTREQILAKWDSMSPKDRSKLVHVNVMGGDPAMFELNYANGRRHYSTDISAAWEVVEMMKQNGWSVTIQAWGDEKESVMEYGATFGFENGPYTANGTAPEAICKAALLAVIDV